MDETNLTAAVQFLIATGEADRLARLIADTIASAAAAPSRDQLAAMAMQGLLAFPGSVCGKHDRDSADVARVSYEIADAMLTEREKPAPAPEPTP